MKITSKSICIGVMCITLMANAACTRSPQTIKVLETSDIHGSIFPYNFITNKPQSTSLAQVSEFVKQERANKDQSVILLDNGDILQGQPTVYYYNYIDTSCENIVSRAFNFMEYDAATVGNHDIEAGPKNYRKVERESNFPWLAANVIDVTTGECAFTPYVVLKRNGIKLAVIGLITPHIPNWLPKQMWPNMEFEDMVESAKKWIEIVKEKENPDVIMGLFHAGHDYTYGHAKIDDYKNENASMLVAQNVSGFDVIMIGHDHDAFCQKVVNCTNDSVLVIDPASNARFVAQTTIKINKNFWGRVTSKEIKGELIDMSTYKSDTSFMEHFKADYQEISEFVNQDIGEFTQTISSKNAFVEPTAFIDFIHTCQLKLTGADISFVAPLSFVSTIKEGKLTMSDMFKLYKFENFLYTMELTGAEVDKYLEYNILLWFNTMTNANDHLLNFRKNADGSLAHDNLGRTTFANNYYNFDSGAGIFYTIDVTKPAGDKVTIRTMADGSAFDPEKTYVVAINSYRGNGGGGHLTTGVGLSHDEIQKRQLSSTTRDLRYHIMEYTKQSGTIDPQPLNSWKLIPEKWTKKAAQRDMDLLFPKK